MSVSMKATDKKMEMSGLVEEISYLLQITYPNFRIHLYLEEFDGPVPPRIHCVEQDYCPQRQDIDGGFAGLKIVGNQHECAQIVTAFAKIPRAAKPEEINLHDEAGALRGLRERLVLAMSPLLFEYAKYRVEQKYQNEHKTAANWRKIPRTNALVVSPASGMSAKPKAKPAILVGFHWLEHGGAEKLAFDCVRWALDAGLRVYVIAQKDGQHRLANRLPKHEDVQFIRMDRYVAEEKATQFLRNFIEKENVRAVHIHHCLPLYEALPTLKSFFPELHVLSSTHILEYKNGGFARVDGDWSNYIDTQHVISRQLHDVMKTKFQSEKGVVLGRLLDPEVGAVATPVLPAALPKERLVISFIGRMSHQKRPIVLAIILKRIARWGKSKGISLSFEIVGEGPYSAAFENVLSRYGIRQLCNLSPATSDIPPLLKKTDILLLPSANEGLALVCYEAVQYGAIPISTDVGAQSELMPDDLLTSADPAKCVKETLKIVQSLVENSNFYKRATTELIRKYETIRNEPTAHAVISKIYQDIQTDTAEK